LGLYEVGKVIVGEHAARALRASADDDVFQRARPHMEIEGFD
jgi:hypothetical protein